ncbi:MAG: hypothetical protein M1812_004597 [Candelaria pacifica]|nr:MAG: hypothetical protein M1812_004597 [Candelaria pacifica]
MSQKARRRDLRQKRARNVQQAKEAEIARLQRAKAAESARKRQIFHFLKLPGEIRNQIYDNAILDFPSEHIRTASPWSPILHRTSLTYFTEEKSYYNFSPLSDDPEIFGHVLSDDTNTEVFGDVIFELLEPSRYLRHSTSQISRELTSRVISQIWLSTCNAERFLEAIRGDSRFKALRHLEIGVGRSLEYEYWSYLHGRTEFSELAGVELDWGSNGGEARRLAREQAAHRIGNVVIQIAKMLSLESLTLDISHPHLPQSNYSSVTENIFLEIVAGLDTTVPTVWVHSSQHPPCFRGPCPAGHYVPLHVAVGSSTQAQYRESGEFLASIYRCAIGQPRPWSIPD